MASLSGSPRANFDWLVRWPLQREPNGQSSWGPEVPFETGYELQRHQHQGQSTVITMTDHIEGEEMVNKAYSSVPSSTRRGNHDGVDQSGKTTTTRTSMSDSGFFQEAIGDQRQRGQSSSGANSRLLLIRPISRRFHGALIGCRATQWLTMHEPEANVSRELPRVVDVHQSIADQQQNHHESISLNTINESLESGIKRSKSDPEGAIGSEPLPPGFFPLEGKFFAAESSPITTTNQQQTTSKSSFLSEQESDNNSSQLVNGSLISDATPGAHPSSELPDANEQRPGANRSGATSSLSKTAKWKWPSDRNPQETQQIDPLPGLVATSNGWAADQGSGASKRKLVLRTATKWIQISVNRK